MKSDEVFLGHILDEIHFILKETSNMSFSDFMESETLKRACSRSLEIIGEAVKNLSSDFRKSHPAIDWKRIAGLRDKVIHLYFDVNWEIIWDVMNNHLPEFKNRIESILNGISQQ